MGEVGPGGEGGGAGGNGEFCDRLALLSSLGLATVGVPHGFRSGVAGAVTLPRCFRQLDFTLGVLQSSMHRTRLAKLVGYDHSMRVKEFKE